MMDHVYRVTTDVEHVTYDRFGNEERYSFPAGAVTNPTEDELFVLERVLAPAGLAVRVKKPTQEQ